MLQKRASAKRDLVEHYVYLAEQGGMELAERFLEGVEESCRDLARHPEMGTPLGSPAQRLSGLRRWRVRGFENYLIFYLARPGGVSIVRVLHGSRDWGSLLGIE